MSREMLRISFLVSIALCAVPSQAQVLHVDDSAPAGGDGSSWALARQDLAQALTIAASSGVSQVWVAEGRYVPSASDSSVSFVLPDGVLVYGGFAGTETSLEQRAPGAHPTLLDGDLNGDDQPNCVGFDDNSMHVVIDTGGASAHLDGFTIRGGRTGPGAGLFLRADHVVLSRLVIEQNCAVSGTNSGAGAETRSAFVAVQDCVFRDNKANNGGGMRLNGSQEAFFSGCVFERNRVTNGAGVRLTGVNLGHTVFRECRFLDNSGSGIALDPEAFASLVVDGCSFERNTATSGGGLTVNSENPGTLIVQNSVFQANEATTGAGLYLNHPDGPFATTLVIEVSSSLFRENEATAGAGAYVYASDSARLSAEFSGSVFEHNRACGGAGIYSNAGPTVVERCVFTDNHLLSNCGLGQGGGAIRADHGEASVEIFHSSFSRSDNSLLWAELGAELRAELSTFSNSGTSAPAIRLTGQSSAVLENCIVWGDAVDQVQAAATASVTAAYSDVRRGGVGLPGTGNFEADPLFVDAAGHDLRLLPGSPCIDVGDPAVLLPGRDLGRYSRMTDGNLDRVLQVDMGAHEASPIELAITGTPAPGSTLTIETSGQPGLSAFLAIDPPGLHFFPRAGSLFLTLTGGFLSHWPSAPSTTPVSVPAGLTGLFHAQAIVLDRGAIAFSNFVPLSF